MKSNIEILKQAEELFHEIITKDLTIRTLELDKARLIHLKINKPLIAWYEKQIQLMQLELITLKGKLGKLGGKPNLEPKTDNNIQRYTLLLQGKIHSYRYMSITLKNLVENELSKQLGVDYVENPYKNDP